MRLYSYSASANCLKVRVLLALLEVPCEIVEVDIFDGGTLTEEFGRLNPLREVPVLELDDGSLLTQSGAILSYLSEGTPWQGTTRLGRAQVAAWLQIEQDRVVPGIGGVRFRLLTDRATAAELAARIEAGSEILEILDSHLSGREWLVGEAPTIADLALWAYVHLAGDAGFDLSELPAVDAWCSRVGEIPGLVDDLTAYDANARPGRGRSIYD